MPQDRRTLINKYSLERKKEMKGDRSLRMWAKHWGLDGDSISTSWYLFNRTNHSSGLGADKPHLKLDLDLVCRNTQIDKLEERKYTISTSVSRGWSVRSQMVPFVYWWAWYLHICHSWQQENVFYKEYSAVSIMSPWP